MATFTTPQNKWPGGPVAKKALFMHIWRTFPDGWQVEIIIAKHRNGGLDEIRLKFVAHLGKFENFETYDYPAEYSSRMNNAANDDTFKTDRLPKRKNVTTIIIALRL